MILLQQKPMEVKYTSNFAIKLPLNVYREMMHYVEKFDTECSGCGLVDMEEKDGGFVFTVSEIFLPDQINTGATTDIDADVVGRLVTRLVRENRPVEKLRFHWHSHVNMSVFHSGTDTDNYNTLKTGEYLVSMVLNKKGEIYACLHYYKPFKLEVLNVPCYVVMADSMADPAWDEAVARIKAYEDDQRTKRIKASKDMRVVSCDDYDDEAYTREWQSWHKGVVTNNFLVERKVAKELATEIVTGDGGYLLMGNIEAEWQGRAQFCMLDVTRNKVARVEVDVTIVRDATEKDYEEAKYDDIQPVC